jgi:hypothetical protein
MLDLECGNWLEMRGKMKMLGGGEKIVDTTGTYLDVAGFRFQHLWTLNDHSRGNTQFTLVVQLIEPMQSMS